LLFGSRVLPCIYLDPRGAPFFAGKGRRIKREFAGQGPGRGRDPPLFSEIRGPGGWEGRLGCGKKRGVGSLGPLASGFV